MVLLSIETPVSVSLDPRQHGGNSSWPRNKPEVLDFSEQVAAKIGTLFSGWVRI